MIMVVLMRFYNGNLKSGHYFEEKYIVDRDFANPAKVLWILQQKLKSHLTPLTVLAESFLAFAGIYVEVCMTFGCSP